MLGPGFYGFYVVGDPAFPDVKNISNNVEQAHQTVRRYAGDRAELAILYPGDDVFQREPGATVTHYEILDFKRSGHGLSFHTAAEWFGRPCSISIAAPSLSRDPFHFGLVSRNLSCQDLLYKPGNRVPYFVR